MQHPPNKKPENWLEMIHQQWVATLDAVREPIFVIDTTGIIVRMNQAFADLAGGEFQDLKGSMLQDILPWLVDADGQPFEQQATCPEGRLYTIRPSPIGSETYATVFVLDDITERHSLAAVEHIYREGTSKSLVEAIDALCAALEAKDPYTVQHSVAVAKISRQLALAMGFDEIEAQGVFYAAKVHDIGKLAIPSGILSKPGKLVQAELNLIQTHCDTGYSIVKHLNFPWPVHSVILQHHERMDGTGYPAGLKGEEISLAARIVAVADVVSAISSHRPYRAALGIEIAVAEIKKERGTLYDGDVVDACIELIEADSAVFADHA